MDGGPSRCIHQNVAPAQPTAVMKLSAPRARAPPNATPKSLRAPEPCSVKANTSPVTMTATVMRTCATVPLRLARIIRSGPSQGMGGPIAAAPDQRVQSDQRRRRAVRVDRRETSRMPGVPRLQERQRLGPADFADHDPIRAEPHGHPRQVREIRHVPSAKLYGVPCGALEL